VDSPLPAELKTYRVRIIEVLPFGNHAIIYADEPVSVSSLQEHQKMITQDIVRKLWNEAGYGNIAIWENDTVTVVPVDYCGETEGKKPLVILKPLALVNRFELLDFALTDEELLTTIEKTVRDAGGKAVRAPK
jgi:hypothetical protein